jgi:hypothetical protein
MVMGMINGSIEIDKTFRSALAVGGSRVHRPGADERRVIVRTESAVGKLRLSRIIVVGQGIVEPS